MVISCNPPPYCPFLLPPPPSSPLPPATHTIMILIFMALKRENSSMIIHRERGHAGAGNITLSCILQLSVKWRSDISIWIWHLCFVMWNGKRHSNGCPTIALNRDLHAIKCDKVSFHTLICNDYAVKFDGMHVRICHPFNWAPEIKITFHALKHPRALNIPTEKIEKKI